ncbi:MAG: heavy metal translocating P-type ATPase [Bacteroidota bacterium]
MTEKSTRITLQVEGMDCSNCAMSITKNLEKKGMKEVYVDFATGEATFFLNNTGKLKTAIDSITELGYKVIDSKLVSVNTGKISRIEKRFYFTLPFTIVLFFSHMLFSHDFFLNNPYIQLMICTPVFVIGILQFGKSAWGSVKTGVPNMDVLIFIGSSAAFIYSIIGIYLYTAAGSHNYLFFETTATIITLVLLGNVLEHRSVKQTTSAIQDLTAMQVNTAKLVSLQLGKEVISEIEVKNIPIGAILQVNTGDKVPADGEIISGEASIDESMLTGESIPIEKNGSDKIIGGTIVVKGNFRMRAESIGDQTVLAKIIELVKKAQQNKPDIQKTGDKISAIFVPVVLGISILTFVLSYLVFHISVRDAMMSSIAVLVVSCPCAMGLATPTAVMVGIGRAAKKGILIKGGNTLEAFAKIKTIVFDKTGTLSTGNFKIKNINCIDDNSKDEVQGVLFQLEQHSSHPIAKSIVNELKGVPATKKFNSVKEEKGSGVSGTDDENNSYIIGSYKIAAHLTKKNDHNIYVLKNGRLMATLDMEDELRPNVKETIHELHRQGISTVLLSGDQQQKCEAFAQKAAIEKIYSEQSPVQKLELIDKFVKENSTAMVGDGINDAPALAKATVGISLSNATQVAIQSAQIILLKNNDLLTLIEARLISKHTLITIKQNLFWAFFYNIVAIPIAAIGLLNPMIGALSMAFSDVIVIGNSIRLKSKKLS